MIYINSIAPATSEHIFRYQQSKERSQQSDRYLQILIETQQLTAIADFQDLRPESVPKVLKRRQEQRLTSELAGGLG